MGVWWFPVLFVAAALIVRLVSKRIAAAWRQSDAFAASMQREAEEREKAAELPPPPSP